MRFLQLLFHAHPIITDADSTLQAFEQNGSLVIDQPDKTITFLLCTANKYALICDGITQTLVNGSLAVLFPDKHYEIKALPQQDRHSAYCMFCIRVVIPDLCVVYCDTAVGHTLTYATQFDTENNKLLLPEFFQFDEKQYQFERLLFEQLVNHYYTNSVSEGYLSIARWYEISAHLDSYTRIALRQQMENASAAPRVPSNGRYVRLTNKYIKEHYQEHLSIPVISATLNISPNYLSAIYKKETGSSITDYINSFRICKLRELLLSNAYIPLSELCVQAGIQDTRYARRLFKKYFGITIQQLLHSENAATAKDDQTS